MPRRKRSPRFIDVAAAAGVSPTTVDRVLNERGSVSPATRARVIEVAGKLGVTRILPDAGHGLVHADVLLPDNRSPFFGRIALALQRTLQMLDRRLVVHRRVLAEDDDAAMALALDQPRHPRRGVVITANDSAPVRAALGRVLERGETVVTLVTDIGEVGRRHYAGIDNRQAGATAGHFAARLQRQPGRVLTLCSRLDYRAHVDRMAGFREAWAAVAGAAADPGPPMVTHDDPEQVYQAVSMALRAGPLTAIYNGGGGGSAIEAALRRQDPGRKVVWIGHELSDEHRAALENGRLDLVIDQDPDGQVVSAIQHLLHGLGLLAAAAPAGPTQFRLHCRWNMDAGPYLPSLTQS